MPGENFFDVREKLARPAPTRPAPDASTSPLTVSAVTKLIDSAVRRGTPPAVSVRGEVSNFNFNRASGHAYFTLKDSNACLNCVMFASEFAQLKFRPIDGMELVAGGGVRVYAQQGRYQLYVNSLQPVGRGALELAFRQLCEKLELEGLFAPGRKRPLPQYPRRIALVTSRETAALADMLKVLRRFPWIELGLFHVSVQGETSGPALASAVELLGRFGQARGYDLILLARGGGSLEDLWGFNDQRLGRAIAASALPVVTGIGHEVDVCIADLVADHHAHTPTEAATFAARFWTAAPAALAGLLDRLHRTARSTLAEARHRLVAVERHDVFRRPADRLHDLRQRLDHDERSLQLSTQRLLQKSERRLLQLRDRLERHAPVRQLARQADRLRTLDDLLQRAMLKQARVQSNRLTMTERRLLRVSPTSFVKFGRQNLVASAQRLDRASAVSQRQRRQQLDALSARLEALSPLAVLRRGFSMTRLKKTGAIVRTATQVSPGARLLTRLADGELESVVEDPRQPGLFE